MRNLLNNPWVVGALCVLALITVYVRVFDSKSPSPLAVEVAQVPAPAPTPAPVPPTPVAASPVNQVASLDTVPSQPITVGWPKEISGDPFQPAATDSLLQGEFFQEVGNQEGGTVRSVTPSAINLHAVFVDGSTRLAMINRELVREGEQIHGYVVDRIQRDGVRLLGKNEPRWLEFGGVQKETPEAS
ncbi:hypothetical protein [Candidatus Nitronereus thalassa]|uniref:Type II secretion system protein GspC N-terminal domain-containing protein n=1 Tax=Candidatus Nitronereus thalassa TaxID=3020898 RepID=A0ABU3K7N3_9BACT|nr:hypothetical protein [Candidatus Nitronereus thalassa]MDT7042358.1 hypothetical protein [Candidatus Nitronereus thalassa]